MEGVSPQRRVAECHLPDGPESVAAARAFVTRTLDGWAILDGGGSLADDARLVVSELVSDALRHHEGELVVTLTADDQRVEVAVTDDHPEILLRPGPTTRDRRRGEVVRQLSVRRGWRAVDGGRKQVWTEIPRQ